MNWGVGSERRKGRDASKEYISRVTMVAIWGSVLLGNCGKQCGTRTSELSYEEMRKLRDLYIRFCWSLVEASSQWVCIQLLAFMVCHVYSGRMDFSEQRDVGAGRWKLGQHAVECKRLQEDSLTVLPFTSRVTLHNLFILLEPQVLYL